MKRAAYRSVTALLLLLLTGMGLSSARAQYYQITDLGTLPGGVATYATSINDYGQVAGTIYFSSLYRAFLWDESFGMIDLYPDALVSQAAGINNQGQVGGSATLPNGQYDYYYVAFLWSPSAPNGSSGSIVTWYSAQAAGINDDGVLCGYAITGSAGPSYYVASTFPGGSISPPPWKPGRPTEETGPLYSAVAINNTGLVLVYVWGLVEGVRVDQAAYIYSRPLGQYIGPANGYTAINDKGQVASLRDINNWGWQVGGSSLLRHGQTVSLETRLLNGSGWSGVTATAINNKGQIAGYGTFNGRSHAFRLDPVLPPPLADFQGTGRNDILFQNQSTGQLAIWLLDIYNRGAGAYVSPSQPNLSWKAVGIGDFNADGKPDILFQNTSTGQLAVWTMNGLNQARAAYVYPAQDPAWQCVSVHDFNGDGMPDLLFQNPKTGQLAIWYLSGNYAVGGAFVYPKQDPGWRCAGTGDFNGDGQIELLFQNKTSGNLAVWYMDKTYPNYAQKAALVPMPQSPAWKAVSVADYDGDGATDILFQNHTTGQLALWYMGGIASFDGAFLVPGQDPNWQVVGPR